MKAITKISLSVFFILSAIVFIYFYSVFVSAPVLPAINITYGEGYMINRTSGTITDGVATYLRYDGIYRPTSELNINTGDWTYLVEAYPNYYNITSDNISFKLPNRTWIHYDFYPDKIKETMNIPSLAR